MIGFLPRKRPVRHRPLRSLAACLTLLACWLAAPVLAGSLQVSPILLEFGPADQAQGLWLSNSGSEPIRAQVRVQQWTQSEQGDQLAATGDLAASPPILQIAPGEQQLVRIVRIARLPADREHAYRLLVDELPASDDAASPGLQFLLRYSVPVFLLPEGAVPVAGQSGERPPTDLSRLSGGFRRGDDGRFVLSLRNDGARRVRISQLTHVAGDGTRTVLEPGLLGYALAGRQMQWTLSLPPAAATAGVLKARFNDDQQEQSLPLDPAGR